MADGYAARLIRAHNTRHGTDKALEAAIGHRGHIANATITAQTRNRMPRGDRINEVAAELDDVRPVELLIEWGRDASVDIPINAERLYRLAGILEDLSVIDHAIVLANAEDLALQLRTARQQMRPRRR